MGVWVCGCVGVLVCGCVGVWVCGCGSAWVVWVYIFMCVCMDACLNLIDHDVAGPLVAPSTSLCTVSVPIGLCASLCMHARVRLACRSDRREIVWVEVCVCVSCRCGEGKEAAAAGLRQWAKDGEKRRGGGGGGGGGGESAWR